MNNDNLGEWQEIPTAPEPEPTPVQQSSNTMPDIPTASQQISELLDSESEAIPLAPNPFPFAALPNRYSDKAGQTQVIGQQYYTSRHVGDEQFAQIEKPVETVQVGQVKDQRQTQQNERLQKFVQQEYSEQQEFAKHQHVQQVDWQTAEQYHEQMAAEQAEGAPTEPVEEHPTIPEEQPIVPEPEQELVQAQEEVFEQQNGQPEQFIAEQYMPPISGPDIEQNVSDFLPPEDEMPNPMQTKFLQKRKMSKGLFIGLIASAATAVIAIIAVAIVLNLPKDPNTLIQNGMSKLLEGKSNVQIAGTIKITPANANYINSDTVNLSILSSINNKISESTVRLNYKTNEKNEVDLSTGLYTNNDSLYFKISGLNKVTNEGFRRLIEDKLPTDIYNIVNKSTDSWYHLARNDYLKLSECKALDYSNLNSDFKNNTFLTATKYEGDKIKQKTEQLYEVSIDSKKLNVFIKNSLGCVEEINLPFETFYLEIKKDSSEITRVYITFKNETMAAIVDLNLSYPNIINTSKPTTIKELSTLFNEEWLEKLAKEEEEEEPETPDEPSKEDEEEKKRQEEERQKEEEEEAEEEEERRKAEEEERKRQEEEQRKKEEENPEPNYDWLF